MIGTVRRVLEIKDGSPVIAKVFAHLARSAGAPVSDISAHGGVEGISTNDMVKMGRRDRARLDDGVESLDSQRRASEAQTCLGRGDEREGESGG